MTKKAIRSYGKSLREGISPRERKNQSQDIANRLYESNYYQHSSYILSYVSFGREVDTHKIILRALSDRKKVYVPRVEGKAMEFYEIHSLEELVRSKYGILEPLPERKHIYQPRESYDKRSALMLLPGLAFDFKGNRIGYGGGYYDRYLIKKSPSRFIKIALAFEGALIEEIPGEEYDVRVDGIITPTKTYTLVNI